MHSYQQCTRVHFFSHPHQHLSLFFLIITIRIGMKWCLCVVLVYVSLMINGVEHPLRYQLIICVSSLEKLFIQILCLFFNQIFLLLSCVNSLCILDIVHLSDIWFANVLSYSAGCLFVSLVGSFVVQSFIVLCHPSCLFLLLFSFFLVSSPKNCNQG